MANSTKPVSVVLPDELLPQIDERAKELDLNRSQYFRRLAKADLETAKRQAPAQAQPEEKAA